MNKELKGRVFKIPQNILDKINHTIVGLEGKNVNGSKRAKKLLSDKTVKYGQLKRIIHDLQNIDKINDRVRYDLYGGDLMFDWSKQYLKGERDLIKDRKQSKKRADEIGAIDGQRKNSYIKKHEKKFSFKIPVNLIKSNSHKTSVSPLKNMKLYEEINKIKKLILY
jgi:hypothetical protein